MFSYCILYVANVSRDCDTESDAPQQIIINFIYVAHLMDRRLVIKFATHMMMVLF